MPGLRRSHRCARGAEDTSYKSTGWLFPDVHRRSASTRGAAAAQQRPRGCATQQLLSDG
ncbi:unnamed protein product, partial [Lampetra planeri]